MSGTEAILSVIRILGGAAPASQTYFSSLGPPLVFINLLTLDSSYQFKPFRFFTRTKALTPAPLPSRASLFDPNPPTRRFAPSPVPATFASPRAPCCELAPAGLGPSRPCREAQPSEMPALPGDPFCSAPERAASRTPSGGDSEDGLGGRGRNSPQPVVAMSPPATRFGSGQGVGGGEPGQPARSLGRRPAASASSSGASARAEGWARKGAVFRQYLEHENPFLKLPAMNLRVEPPRFPAYASASTSPLRGASVRGGDAAAASAPPAPRFAAGEVAS